MPQDLNDSQKKAVTCPLKPTLVIAGPGSGKTHVIINRIHYMMHYLQCRPFHILVVTFSKLAAGEMQERFNASYPNSGVTFGTLHSVFYRILKKSDPMRYSLENLLSDHDKKNILLKLYRQLEMDEYEDFIEEFLRHMTLMKNQLIQPKYYYPDGISKENFLNLLSQYETYKASHHKFDFDDMLVDCYHLLNEDLKLLRRLQEQYQYLLVDEFQDINLVQFELIKMLAGKAQNIFVVGDDDQSIYKFRGAKPEFLLDFKNHFIGTQEFFLEVNYRSTKNILNYSIALITSNQNRYNKKLTTPNELGKVPYILYCKNIKEQGEWVFQTILDLKKQGEKLGHMAIIYRTNIEARPIVQILLRSLIPFCLRDGMTSLYDQWVTKDILAYLYLAQDLSNTSLAVWLMNKPKRYISRKICEALSHTGRDFFPNLLAHESLNTWQKDHIQKFMFDLQVLKEKPLSQGIAYIRKTIGYDDYIRDYATYRQLPSSVLFEMLDELQDASAGFIEVKEWERSLADSARQLKEQSAKRSSMQDVLTLTTMHGAKGLEFKHVFILNVIEGNIPHSKSQSEVELEEERRLFYVAMTRAKKNLYMTVPSEKYSKSVAPSLFIEEILNKLALEHLKKGKNIVHNKFGPGKILNVIDGTILEVQFSSQHIRKIDSNYCINNGIIHWEE